MKPVHIVALVFAGALGGAVLMKLVQHPQPVSTVAQEQSALPVTAPAPIETAAAQPPAPAPIDPLVVPAPTSPAATEPPPPVERVPAVQPPEPDPARVATMKKSVPKSEPIHKSVVVPKPVPARHTPPPANPRPFIVAKLPTPAAPTPQPVAPPVVAPAPLEPLIAPATQERSSAEIPPPPPPQPENVTPPAPLRPAPHTVTLNTGLLIPVRLLDGLSSERNQPGDNFVATLDRELVVDGFVIAEKGARVDGRVVASDRGSRVNAGATLSVELIRLHTSDRQVVPIQTEAFARRNDPNRRTDA